MALCKKCGQREQHTFPNGRTVALCAVCGWNAIIELLDSPEVGGLTPLALDACPYCLGKGKEPANGVLVRCRFCAGTGKRQ